MQITHRSDEGLYYRGLPIHAPPNVHEDALRLLTHHVPSGSVVELGAGSGAFTRRMADAGFSVEPVDLDPSGWRPADIPVRTLDLNAPQWDLPKSSYDAAVAVEVIEHVENPSQVLRNARELLRPGGILFLTTPNVVSIASRRQMLRRGELALFERGLLFEAGHLTPLPHWLLEDILEKEGFESVECRFIGRQPIVFRPGRPLWKCALVPWVDLLLLALGHHIPREAAFAMNVAFVARVRG